MASKLSAQPQLYHTAIGLNAGYNYGTTLKHYLSAKNLIEGIANFNYGPGLTVLYVFNNLHPFTVDEFDRFYGLGAHAKFVIGKEQIHFMLMQKPISDWGLMLF